MLAALLLRVAHVCRQIGQKRERLLFAHLHRCTGRVAQTQTPAAGIAQPTCWQDGLTNATVLGMMIEQTPSPKETPMTAQQRTLVRKANHLIDEALELQNQQLHEDAEQLLDEAEILLDEVEAGDG